MIMVVLIHFETTRKCTADDSLRFFGSCLHECALHNSLESFWKMQACAVSNSFMSFWTSCGCVVVIVKCLFRTVPGCAVGMIVLLCS